MNDDRSGRVHYIHRLSYTTQERLVGAFVLSGLLLLCLLAVFSREASTLFADKFTLVAHIKDARGIAEDTPVQMSGVQVGRVKRLDVVGDGMIRVEMEMLERFHPLVRDDARAALSKLSMIGKPTIELHGGSGSKPPIADRGVIPITEPPNFDQMLADVAPALRNLQAILERLNAITGAVEPKRVKSLATNLDNASADLPQLVAEARAVAAQMNATLAGIDTQMQQMPELVQRSRTVMDQMDRTLHGVQNTWPLSSSMPPAKDQQMVDPRPLP